MAQIEIMLTGVGIVLGALVLLWWLTALMGALYGLADKANNKRPLWPGPVGAAGKPVPHHHLVAIATAVEAVFGRPHRIVSVRAPAARSAG